MFTPVKHLPTLGQRGHSPQRHTAADTAAPTTTENGKTVPQRANHTRTAYTQAQAQKGGPGPDNDIDLSIFIFMCTHMYRDRNRCNWISRPTTTENGEHSPTARQAHSNGLCSPPPPKGGGGGGGGAGPR